MNAAIHHGVTTATTGTSDCNNAETVSSPASVLTSLALKRCDRLGDRCTTTT
jgi:hypothetical protein